MPHAKGCVVLPFFGVDCVEKLPALVLHVHEFGELYIVALLCA